MFPLHDSIIPNQMTYEGKAWAMPTLFLSQRSYNRIPNPVLPACVLLPQVFHAVLIRSCISNRYLQSVKSNIAFSILYSLNYFHKCRVMVIGYKYQAIVRPQDSVCIPSSTVIIDICFIPYSAGSIRKMSISILVYAHCCHFAWCIFYRCLSMFPPKRSKLFFGM